MFYSRDLKKLAFQINWKDFIQRFRLEGWREYPTKRRSIVRIFQKDIGDDDFVQVTVPIDRNLSDFNSAMFEAVKIYADVNQQPVERVILELINPVSDYISFRVVAPNNECANISFKEGIALYTGIANLIDSAAKMAVEQIPKGRKNKSLDELLSRCQFSQTEIGSYVVSAILPFETSYLTAEDSYFVAPLARLTSKEIMEQAADTLQLAADENAEELIATKTIERKKNGIVFLKALRSLCNLGNSTVNVSGKWSPKSTLLPKNNSFCLSYDSYEVFDSAVKIAEKSFEPKDSVCAGVGKIEKLQAEPDVKERQFGLVSVRAMLEGKESRKPVRIELKLPFNDYTNALNAHENGKIIRFEGCFVPNEKHINCTKFAIID